MTCIHVKDDGESCKAHAMTDSEYCYTHNPEVSPEDKRLARVRGGEARSLTVLEPLPDLPIESPRDAVVLVSDTIKRVRAGELDIKTANCIGFLTDKLLKAYEVAELNEKVEFVEKVVLERKSRL